MSMFNTLLQESAAASVPVILPPTTKPAAKLSRSIYPSYQRHDASPPKVTTLNTIDQILENETLQNKADTWNKLDKTAKMQKLHLFSDKYGKEHGYESKTVDELKQFFSECLEKNKLQKTKEVVYDKERREIVSIPALTLRPAGSGAGGFTLKVMDKQRVSTLKALAPMRRPVGPRLVLEEPTPEG